MRVMPTSINIYRNDMGSNFILCNICYKLVHKRCSSMNGRLQDALVFECAVGRKVKEGRVMHSRPNRVDLENVSFECVDEFHYLGRISNK